MKLKNSLISIAAAGALVAGLTGCGGGGGTATTNNETPTVTTSASSFEVVDGKVMNAKVTVYYFDEDNNEQSYVLTDDEMTRSYTPTTAGSTAVAGSYQYSLPSSIAATSVSYVKVEEKAAELTSDKDYHKTYIDIDGDKTYTTGTDLDFEVTLEAPKGMPYITSATTLAKKLLEDANGVMPTDLNDTTLATALEQAAFATGQTVADLSTDPTLDPSRKAMAAFASDLSPTEMAALVTSLKATPLTAQKTFAESISFIAETTDSSLFTNLKTVVAGMTSDELASINADAIRENGGEEIVLASASSTAFAKISELAVNDDINSSKLTSMGDKINSDDLNLTVTFAGSTDAADTTGSVDLIVQLSSPKDNISSDAANDRMTVKISGLELERDDDVTSLSYNTKTATVSYAVVDDNSSLTPYYAFDSSVEDDRIDLTDLIKNTDNVTSINIMGILDMIVSGQTLADTDTVDDYNSSTNSVIGGNENNLTTTVADKFSGAIVNVKVGLVDANGAVDLMNPADSTKAIYWPSMTVSDSLNTGLNTDAKVILNATLDWRDNVTRTNNAPDMNVSIGGTTYGTQDIKDDEDNVSKWAILSDNTAYDLNGTVPGSDLTEENSTIALEFATYLTPRDANVTYLKNNVSDGTAENSAFNVDSVFDVNLTDVTNVADTNITTSITVKVQDEFSKSETTVIPAFVNRAPYISIGSLTANGLDANGEVNTSDSNTSHMPIAADYDDYIALSTLEINATLHYPNDMNHTATTGLDLNSSYQLIDCNLTADINLTEYSIGVRFSADNSAIEFNRSMTLDKLGYDTLGKIFEGQSLTLEIKDLNDTIDQYNNGTDINKTLSF
jgi:hypothetical protein